MKRQWPGNNHTHIVILTFALQQFHFNMYAFDVSKPIAIGCDHAGFERKEELISMLEAEKMSVKDFGAYSTDSVDYPDFAHPVALAVEQGNAAFGILLCGSGEGVCITANKHKGIRAALCWEEEIAELSRKHNDANILCIPARFVNEHKAENILDIFMNTAFEGGRHENRVNKIPC